MSSTKTTPLGPGTTTGRGRAGWVLPIALFSIPLGLAGLGGAWAAATQLLGASRVPADLAYGGATLIWAAFTIVYVVGAILHESGRFRLDLRHPLFGPLTAYIPVIAILLVAHYAASLGDAARWLILAAVGSLAVTPPPWWRTG